MRAAGRQLCRGPWYCRAPSDRRWPPWASRTGLPATHQRRQWPCRQTVVASSPTTATPPPHRKAQQQNGAQCQAAVLVTRQLLAELALQPIGGLAQPTGGGGGAPPQRANRLHGASRQQRHRQLRGQVAGGGCGAVRRWGLGLRGGCRVHMVQCSTLQAAGMDGFQGFGIAGERHSHRCRTRGAARPSPAAA
jgi:hypothetical protein